MRGLALTFIFLLSSIDSAVGQRVQWRAFRLTEENEFFNITQHGIDRFYTQGLRLEFQYQVSERKLLEKVVIPIRTADVNIYSVSLSQQIYTPGRTDIYIPIGDHPYGGNLFFSESLESYDSSSQFRLISRLDAGLIGPASMAESTQQLFHKIIQNEPAVAWDTQLRNDIYLNYHVKWQQAFTKHRGYFRLEGKGEVNVGSALISLVPGLNVEIGTWYRGSKRKFSWQLFFNPEVRVMVFNAMIQGGILNQLYADKQYSQFFIDKIKPLVYSHSTGFRIRYNRFEMLYRQVNLTREFTGQRPHYYSTLTLTFPLKSRI